MRLAMAYLRDQYGLRRGRRLRYLYRSAWFLATSPFRPYVEAEMSGLRVVLSTADRTIARSVYAAGDWDPLLVGTTFRALAEHGWRAAGRTFLEVGANFGVYALPAVAEYGFARAVAYEPDPAAFELLAANIARNGLGDRVTAVNAALSGEPGELTLSRGRGNAGDNRIVRGRRGRRGRGGRFTWQQRDTVKVPALTFDDQVGAGVIKLDELGLVWLDVQGHEPDVLAGAVHMLEAGVPLVTEYCTAMLDEGARAGLDQLLIENYDLFVDLGWSALTNRIVFQPVADIRRLAPAGRGVETDLLLLRRQ